MRQLAHWEFDAYAMSLPRGLGFGTNPPAASFISDDGDSWVTICCDDEDRFSYFMMRRRVDRVWTKIAERGAYASHGDAFVDATLALDKKVQPEPLPPGMPRRPRLYDVGDRAPSDILKLLARPSHRPAAWMLEQLYLALPNPDPNWASDLQAGNFHTRLWEAQLLASFREQGLLVTQPLPSPDFKISNRSGSTGWIEAVTANPAQPYEHVNADPSLPPDDIEQRFFGDAAVRFAKTLGNKIARAYWADDDVAGHPFAIAIADFHAPASMQWSREALIGYLYGLGARAENVDGTMIAVPFFTEKLLGPSGFPAGLFADDKHAGLSAILFSNACSIAKFNRVAISGGGAPDGYHYIRSGTFADWTPGAVTGIPFRLDIVSAEYRGLWPQGYEPWCAELEVFHNPFAAHPLPHDLLPEAMHWFDQDGEIMSSTIYPRSILASMTEVIHEKSDIGRSEAS